MSQPDFIFDEATEHALLAYVEGIASPQQHAAVVQLLRHDARLAAMVAELRADRQKLTSLPSVKAPANIAAQVAQQVTANAERRRRRPHWLDTTVISLIAATLLVICLPLALLQTAPHSKLRGQPKRVALLNKPLIVSAPRLALNAAAQHRSLNQLQQTPPTQAAARVALALPKAAMKPEILRQAAAVAVPVIILDVHTAAQRQAVMREIDNIRTATATPATAAFAAAAGRRVERPVGQAGMAQPEPARAASQSASPSTWLLRLTPIQLRTLQQLAASAPAPAKVAQAAAQINAPATTRSNAAAAKNAAATAPAATSRLYKIIVRLTLPAPTKH